MPILLCSRSVPLFDTVTRPMGGEGHRVERQAGYVYICTPTHIIFTILFSTLLFSTLLFSTLLFDTAPTRY